MRNRNTTLTFLVFSLLLLFVLAGCGGESSPIAPLDQSSPVSMIGDIMSNSAQSSDSYSGTMLDASGNPLAYAELWADGELAGWTEEDGSFVLYGIQPETEFKLEAKIDGDLIYSTTVGEDRSAQGLGDNDPNIERGTVFGQCTDQMGPVAGAIVIAFNQDQNFGVGFSGNDGNYLIDDAPAGPCKIVAFAPQHAAAHEQVEVIANSEVQKDLFLPKLIEFGIIGGRVITGPVNHLKPVPHAKVHLQPLEADVQGIDTYTNQHGIYIFPHIPLELHKLTAGALCFSIEEKTILVHPGQNFVGFHLEVIGCGGVEGQVTNTAGEIVPGAFCRIVPPPPNDGGNPPGDPGNPPGDPNGPPPPPPNDPPGGDPNGSPPPPPGGPQGPPILGWDFSGPAGHYLIKPIPPGEYMLLVNRPGYLPYVEPVSVNDGEIAIKDVVLTPGNGNGDPGGPG